MHHEGIKLRRQQRLQPLSTGLVDKHEEIDIGRRPWLNERTVRPASGQGIQQPALIEVGNEGRKRLN